MTAHEARRVETYLRLQSEAALRRARRDEPPPLDADELPAAGARTRKSLGDWFRWLASQAWALADVGALDDATASSVIGDLGVALSVRGAFEDFEPFGWRAFRMRPAQDGSPPSGPMRVVQVGAAVDGELQGQPFSVRLGTMVLDPDGALLTMTATPPTGPKAPGSGLGQLRTMIHALRQCPATDDKGASYELAFSGGGSDEHWEGTLSLRPGPPEDARWLDVRLPGAEPLRIFLDPDSAAPTTTRALPASEAAERYVDGLALLLLHDACSGDHGSERYVGAAVCGLLGAGVLAADSPVVGRLAGVAARLRRHLALPDTPPADLPEHWQVMLRRQRGRNGPIGVIPFAAVLPELDGARCAIMRITSERRSATIEVYARGWPYRPTLDGHHGPFFWTARDDAGGCYAASSGARWRSSHGTAELTLDVRPAINPRARELQVILTGRTGEVSVSVPLDWQESP